MKISRKVGLIIGAVIIVAALVSLYVVYSGQAGEREELEERRETAETLSFGLTTQKQELEDQLTSAQSSLDASQKKFPASVESIEYGEYLFKIAEDCNVNLESLKFPTPTDKKVGAVTYSVVSLTLPISGTLENIFQFVDAIRTDANFASTEVKSVNINMGSKGTTATIAVDIYGYKG
jgi:hypothetical protein